MAIGKTSVKTVDSIATRRSGSTGKEEDEDDGDDGTLTQDSRGQGELHRGQRQRTANQGASCGVLQLEEFSPAQ